MLAVLNSEYCILTCFKDKTRTINICWIVQNQVRDPVAIQIFEIVWKESSKKQLSHCTKTTCFKEAVSLEKTPHHTHLFMVKCLHFLLPP